MHYEDNNMKVNQAHHCRVTAGAPTELQGYYLSAKYHYCRSLVDRVVRQNLHRLFIIGALFLIIAVGAGCHPTNSETGDSHAKIVKSSDPNVFEIGYPEQFPLVEVEGRKIADEIHANGVITPDVNRSVAVLSLGGGRVVDIKVRLGDDVRKGQLLLQIHSPDLASAFSDFQKAQADEMLARKQLERSQTLYAYGAIAEKDLEAAQNAEDKAKVDLKTAQDRVRLLGGNPNHISSILEVRAPISGTIVEQNVSGGTGVRSLDNSPNLFTIADLSRVWVLCDIYEDTISQIHIGDEAEVRLNAYPDRLFSGRVSNIGRVLDPSTRSAKVRIELDNPGLIIRSGMFATVVFHSQKQVERPVLPTSAIVRLHDKNWVFRSLGGNRFQKIEVQTGPQMEDNSQVILSGVQIHDKVVANALQFSRASEAQ